MGDTLSKEITIIVNYGRKKTKEFIIGIVPNRFTVDYHDYVGQYGKVIELSNRLRDAETNEQLIKIQSEMEGLGLAKILENKYNLIKTVMIANEYDFDYDFWDLKVSPKEVDRFVSECALKDNEQDVKKKAERMLKLITAS